MPIYEFVCRECETLVEFLVKNSREEIALHCSSCGSSELQRVISRCHSSVRDGGGGQRAGSDSGGALQERSCPSGSCSTLTLPGYTR